jgi:hypothetical protein
MVAHQASDGMKRVEHEVRLHLPAQRRELRPGELLIKSRGLGHLKGHARSRVHYKGNGQYQRVHDQERQTLEEE